MTFEVILIFHVILAISLVAIILMQQGKGAQSGSSLGVGSSSDVFGTRTAKSFVYRVTFWLACAFFITSILLAYLATSDRAFSSESLIIQDEQENTQ